MQPEVALEKAAPLRMGEVEFDPDMMIVVSVSSGKVVETTSAQNPRS